MGIADAVDTWLAAQWCRRPSRFDIDVDGAAIACHGWNLEASHLPGIVLVHGFRAHAHWWDHIAPWLAERRRVVAISLSGMGDSGARERYSRRQFAREVLGVARACGFDSAILVTHSFGTLGGLLAVNQAPDRFARMIMIDAGLPVPGRPEHQPSTMPLRLYSTREAALARFRLLPAATWPVQQVHDYIASNSIKQVEGGWTWKFDPQIPATLGTEDYRADLEGVPIPVDIILGADTTIMTPERVAEARRIAPLAGQPIAIGGSGHHVMIEQPTALAAALDSLLANPRQLS